MQYNSRLKEILFFLFSFQENKGIDWSQWIPYLLNKLKKADLLLKLDSAQVPFFCMFVYMV